MLSDEFFPSPVGRAESMLRSGVRARSSAPEVFEPSRRQLGVAHRVLNVLVAEIGLKGAGVVPL